MNSEQAETLALEALAWIAGQDDLLPVFMGASGASVDDLRGAAQNPSTLGAVLDFLTMDDAWVTQFCDAHGHAYDQPLRARQSLPGGDLPNWT
ncbi:DUF3572 domain-containing protein [Alphaproteobacteria bacterium KMM 3653]|uniref:DUF3572 domain-containing protein n=1 Tax=Harenicola maris TaxID=2841044 RepID=A0AAP2G5C0_9RHOB|nr:DUF3572 domain-containing protein [Harenicola maris]